MWAYCSHDLEVEEIKEEAKKEWEAWKYEAAPNLALLIQADLHSGKSEQRLGKETLKLTQASSLEVTGSILLSDDARQALILGVCSWVRVWFPFSIQFPGMFSLTKICSLLQALQDLQLSNELEGRAIHLRKEALSSIIMALGGTQATGLVKFLMDSFGGSED